MPQGSSKRIVAWVPNALSAARVPLSIGLLFLRPFTTWFFGLYLVCGATDFLDGWLARRLHATSRLGARLDSFADMTLFVVVFYILVASVAIPAALIAWAVAIVAVRAAAQLHARKRFGTWAMLHTSANRLCAFLFYCLPFGFLLFGSTVSSAVVCAAATLSVSEEVYINEHADIPMLDIKSYRCL